ncbi:MAG TPA: tetratricopeptide repeat protein [Methylomirabilota bacterium]|nr:tetratricopeptide repeat protein [Methylomirabilota bacterium]
MESGSPPSAGFYDFLGWLDQNKQRVALGAGVAFVLAVVVGFFVWRSGQREIEAERALSSVPVAVVPGEMPPPGMAEAVAKIAEDFPKTPAAAKALLRAGTIYFDQNNFTKAQEQFDKLLRDYGETVWVPQAVYGLAACLDAQNKPSEAIAKYNDFTRAYPSDPAADQARLSLARLYEQTKQPALALDLLKKMTEGQQGAFGPGAAEAQERLRELYAKNPSLIPSNPVAPPTMFSPMPAPPTNASLLTNLIIRSTNAAASASPAAPNILLPSPNTNAGK